MTDKLIQATVRITKEMHDKLREISYLNRIAINNIIINAIKEYIKEGKWLLI